jgi:hypothetical protein
MLKDFCTMLVGENRDERILVYSSDSDGWFHYHAVTMGISCSTFPELEFRVRKAWNMVPSEEEEAIRRGQERHYRYQYDYACGYRD